VRKGRRHFPPPVTEDFWRRAATEIHEYLPAATQREAESRRTSGPYVSLEENKATTY